MLCIFIGDCMSTVFVNLIMDFCVFVCVYNCELLQQNDVSLVLPEADVNMITDPE